MESQSGSKLRHPSPDGLVRDVEPAFGLEFLNVSVAQSEPQIELDGVPDDLGRELKASIGNGLHPPILLRINSTRQLFL